MGAVLLSVKTEVFVSSGAIAPVLSGLANVVNVVAGGMLRNIKLINDANSSTVRLNVMTGSGDSVIDGTVVFQSGGIFNVDLLETVALGSGCSLYSGSATTNATGVLGFTDGLQVNFTKTSGTAEIITVCDLKKGYA